MEKPHRVTLLINRHSRSHHYVPSNLYALHCPSSHTQLPTSLPSGKSQRRSDEEVKKLHVQAAREDNKQKTEDHRRSGKRRIRELTKLAFTTGSSRKRSRRARSELVAATPDGRAAGSQVTAPRPLSFGPRRLPRGGDQHLDANRNLLLREFALADAGMQGGTFQRTHRGGSLKGFDEEGASSIGALNAKEYHAERGLVDANSNSQ